ncbi:hypothetical protein ACOMHN_026366 [Nucella lapillus]
MKLLNTTSPQDPPDIHQPVTVCPLPAVRMPRHPPACHMPTACSAHAQTSTSLPRAHCLQCACPDIHQPSTCPLPAVRMPRHPPACHVPTACSAHAQTSTKPSITKNGHLQDQTASR